MLTDKKVLPKLDRMLKQYAELRYEQVASIPVDYAETREHFRSEPPLSAGLQWAPARPGTVWGSEWTSAWFRGDLTLPPACTGRKVFVRARTGGWESTQVLFFIDGEPSGCFDRNHPVRLLTPHGVAGARVRVAFEAYAGHWFPGHRPEDNHPPVQAHTFEGIDLLLERADVSAFYFDLLVLLKLARVGDDNNLRRQQVIRELARVWEIVVDCPADAGEAVWRPPLAAARQLMAPLLARHNGPTAPRVATFGHSHLDTAWLWPLAETWRKCARTFSSMVSLQAEYPEMVVLQSSPYHTEVTRQLYPSLFARIKELVAAGRWEPNGCMWVEPDCNIPSGESLVRQVLVAQNWLHEHFGYRADTLWQPDVFGYSAALPQILRQAGVEFFCTTKLGWNDTTRFPYDLFHWQGLDGSTVLAHLHALGGWLDPLELTFHWNYQIQHKDIQDRTLLTYGWGDGGGGPQTEMLEILRRCQDLEGCPRTQQMSLSAYLRQARAELHDLPSWCGELYLEMHRGTLTSQARIKRGNRQAEAALREAEFLATLAAVRGADYPAARLLELWKMLLVNQFHDILPGSSIVAVNDQAVRELGACVAQARDLAGAAARAIAGAASPGAAGVAVFNSLSWPRTTELTLAGVPPDQQPADPGVSWQWLTDVHGTAQLAVRGLTLVPLGATWMALRPRPAGASSSGASAFTVRGDTIETPVAVVRLDASGRIVSLVDKATGRDAVAPGGAFNTLWLGEDIPETWENWDLDRDHALKLQRVDTLEHRELVAAGPLQLRLRLTYRLGTHSRLVQDLILHADSLRADFESRLDWQGKRQLLKAGFTVNVQSEVARHEIQYGHVQRPTHANLPQDRARFEVCAHRWTDLSDNGGGVALLNDCKYGVGVAGNDLRLSLQRSGLRPDHRGDPGVHAFTYAILPHAGGFSVPGVVRPAYELNLPPTVVTSASADGLPGSLLTVDAPNMIVDAVKWAECGRAVVVRLYEAGGAASAVGIRLGLPVTRVQQVNLLEEEQQVLPVHDGMVKLTVRPFELVTLRCEVAEALH